MTGPKLNERSFVAGERTGTKASVRGSRMSASKARVVLNLIRGRDVVMADQVLQFTEREAARVIRKVLASAVANAVNNDGLEAETLRRFKPRAKGRATRINKRTCHITIVLAVIDAELLTVVQARRERAVSGRRATRGGGVADRRARVQASRTKRTDGGDDAAESTTVEEVTLEDTTIEATAVENSAPEAEETN